jgi:cyclic beta-1,2-glucan synthetase
MTALHLKSAPRVPGQSKNPPPWNSDRVLREELFSIERLEQHAVSLAAAQAVTPRPVRRPPLSARLKENEAVLLDCYRALAAAVRAELAITPAAEWLLDNFHLVEAQSREIRADLPPGFYRQLPKLDRGPLQGYPRVFGLAWAFVAHSDSHFDPESLRRFVRAYQTVQPLTIGELWAIAIVLRVVLVENLRRAAQQIVGNRAARQQADDIADRLLGVSGREIEPDALLQRYARDPALLVPPLVVQLVHRLRDQDPRVTPALQWIEERLAVDGTSAEQIVHAEHQRQGSSNVTVRNIITSMRLISELEWSEFFESVSLVDEALRGGSHFAQMDLATRNLYRNSIETLAAGSSSTELQVTRAALAATQRDAGAETRCEDPGYHLLGAGRRDFEAAIGYRAPWRALPARWIVRHGAGAYIGGILVFAVLLLTLPLLVLAGQPIPGWQLALLALLGVLPAMDVAIAVTNRMHSSGLGAAILPGYALREGVPAELRTLLAVPTLLTTPAAIAAMIEQLEVHYLAAPAGHLHFALLTDWVDADTEHTAQDQALLDAAVEGIARLNLRHGPALDGDRFLLLHRRRKWCAVQQQWIGWERKRGKLRELNRLLRGAVDTTFISIGGNPPRVPAGVRYVITLDADTRLPRETLRRLIGKLSHPLNRPRLDPMSGRVVEGYGILQPRITPALPMSGEGSLFQSIVSSTPGLDPYASAVSDVYQDLFGEGSYSGKGIYDVDAFEAALADRSGAGELLSHDLFEGIFARAGLVSDVELVEEFPARYDVEAARQHRWARGDWQLLPWLIRGRRRAVPILGRWKILDNLRRTLSAPASVAALVAGWMLPLPAAVVWTAFLLACIALPAVMPVVASLLPGRAGITARSHFRVVATELGRALRQIAFQAIFLAAQTGLMVDAIGRSLYRQFVSRRRLLEWTTAAQSTASERFGLGDFYRSMAIGLAVTAAAAVIVVLGGSTAGWIALPFLVAWTGAPAVAWWISRPRLAFGRRALSPTAAHELRLVARRTWRYFETFVTPADHMLPPDNFQEDPQPVLARRTSPTNLGLCLLSTASARDFGWIGTAEASDRLAATLQTMESLARCRGHFYNWYDTSDLRPLDPRYVSTVDSGNLAAHLIAIANAAYEWREDPVAPAIPVAGARDAVQLAREALDALRLRGVAGLPVAPSLEQQLAALETSLQVLAEAPADLPARLQETAVRAAELADLVRALALEDGDDAWVDLRFWCEGIGRSLASWRRDLMMTSVARLQLNERLIALAATARTLADGMQFGFLFDPHRGLLSIGYRAADGTLDPSCYDLLASEARLASFVAIAKGDIPTRHWFRLGRPVTAVGAGVALVSWSGSMFEYLMPSLVMRAPAGSLLAQTNRLIVRRQVAYGAERQRPWGISESAYHARDLELTYQYSNFGVPGLGLKRGLGDDTVVAPYATALAAMVDPASAVVNFARLASLGALGRYGFHEAVDYTERRLPTGKSLVVVRAFMAHHQGMTIVAIGNVLLDGIMRRRFHAEPLVQATELLLQERTPRTISVEHPRAEDISAATRDEGLAAPEPRRLHTANEATPQAHLLSNGRYAVMITAAGSGYSRWGGTAITRWRGDATRDDAGSYLFLRDVESGRVWSAGYQPCASEPEDYEVIFADDHAVLARLEGEISSRLEIMVSAEDDAEVRRLSLTNTGSRTRIVEVTSYMELSLAAPAADAAHPAFSKLFVQTEHVPRLGALLATRRKRSPEEAEIWISQHAIVEGEVIGVPEIETDRARFLGRNREIRAPIAMIDGRRLSNTAGAVLDPIFALRRRLKIPAGETARIAFWTGAAASRQQVLDLLDRHHDASAFERAGTLAWTQAQVQLRHLGISAREASLFQRLAGHVLYADAALRPPGDALARAGGGPPALWRLGISGDLPIVLLRIENIADIAIVRQLMQAHEYWRMKQLAVDLVILNEHAASYERDLQAQLESLDRKRQSHGRPLADGVPGAVFLLRGDLLPESAGAMLAAVARVVLVTTRGGLAVQLDRLRRTPSPVARKPQRAPADAAALPAGPARADLEYFNGLGGFAEQGREYVTLLGPGRTTPAPWINVVANPAFGFQVAAEGSGFTWSMNSRENQLTPWSNDPVSDRTGEAIYLRDEDSGDLWGPTAAPIHDPEALHAARHGQGYSRFEHASRGLALDLLMYVPLADPVKISRLRIRNDSPRIRRLSVTAYVEWVLGTVRAASAPSIVTSLDAETGALLAQNTWGSTFAGRVAFLDLSGRQSDWTADRREFLGRHGSLAQPAALSGAQPLSGRVGAGLDPCGALRAFVTIEPGATAEVVILLGETGDAASASALLQHYRAVDIEAAHAAVIAHWDDVLGTVQVRTPDRSMDLLLNRWALYQTLACRLWARTAFYQASGAYGFRDQLQDAMAVAITRPQLTREHLLRAAARQFIEGDVQHWWLPQTGLGVRTRISDDLVWLAYATAHYVETTADAAVLDEQVPFIAGEAVADGAHDAYFLPTSSGETATLYEHCARALDHSLGSGERGLPLIGTGDWNDGMNRVGELGRGESIWLGWFLLATLAAFGPLATARGDRARAERWRAHAVALRAALERNGWDGDWYRRGYFDDGTPLGSATSEECRIDSIAQSWGVISGAADPARAARAMAAVDAQLIARDAGLALLFTPPFDQTPLEPGYIKSYPPGVRENGGQYTHAATWSVIAFALLGQGDKATELFAMLNPVNRSTTRADAHRYKVEPYAVAADVYSVAPHVGRGGWTWYTGAAGWMYRAGLEWILGFRLHGDRLRLAPCIPRDWPGFEISFRYRSTCYEIAVENPLRVSRGVARFELDNRPLDAAEACVALVDDGATHRLRLVLGPA